MAKNIVKLKIAELVSAQHALAKLFSASYGDFKTTWSLARSAKKVSKAFKEYNEKREDIAKKYSEKDEKGEAKLDERGNYILADKDAFSKEYKELLESEIEVDVWPIQENALKEAKLSPVEVGSIEMFLVAGIEEKDEPVKAEKPEEKKKNEK